MPNFGCCTANHIQGWAKFVANGILLRSTADGGVVIATLAPVAMNHSDSRSNFSLTIVTKYPFGDNATITLENHDKLRALPLHLRIPGWATNASVSHGTLGTSSSTSSGSTATISHPPNGTMYVVSQHPPSAAFFYLLIHCCDVQYCSSSTVRTSTIVED